MPWNDTLLVAEVIRYNKSKACNTLRYFRAWADKKGGSYYDEFEYPAFLATDAEVAAAQAEQEAVDEVLHTKRAVKRAAPRDVTEGSQACKQRTLHTEKRKCIETALVAETTREDEETNARKRRKLDTTEVARTLLTFSGNETAPTDTSDATAETMTTAPPVDDETSPPA